MAVAKRVNKNRFFNFDTRIKDLRGKNYNDIVEAFKKRIEKWFIYPVDIIIERDKTEGHLTFPVILIDCALIECLCQFYTGKKESSKDDYKSFLRNIIDDFSKRLKRKNTIKRHGSVRKEELRDYADIFYYAFRCGLMHSAMIKSCGRIKGQANLVEYNETEGILAVQPLLLHEKLKNFFYNYIDILLKRKDKKRIINFRRKMWIDFATRVPK